jgi:hypothetical protein
MINRKGEKESSDKLFGQGMQMIRIRKCRMVNWKEKEGRLDDWFWKRKGRGVANVG